MKLDKEHITTVAASHSIYANGYKQLRVCKFKKDKDKRRDSKHTTISYTQVL